MVDLFKDIFEYHHYMNQKLVDQLIENEAAISDRSIPLFSHMINAHHIWNARILQTQSVGVNDIRSLPENKEMDKQNVLNSLKIVNGPDLDRVITYRTSRGDELRNSIRDILFHIANHHTHHRGQIISDLRLNGIAPIVTDYIFYKR